MNIATAITDPLALAFFWVPVVAVGLFIGMTLVGLRRLKPVPDSEPLVLRDPLMLPASVDLYDPTVVVADTDALVFLADHATVSQPSGDPVPSQPAHSVHRCLVRRPPELWGRAVKAEKPSADATRPSGHRCMVRKPPALWWRPRQSENNAVSAVLDAGHTAG